MTNHVSDELPRLLTGEASHDDVMAAAVHLRGCVDCQHELVSDVVAHASLTSAHRFAPEVVQRPAIDNFAAEDSASTEADALPDLSAVFAQVRREAEQDLRPDRARRRRRYLVGAAAAAVVAVGAGTAIYAVGSDNGGAARTVALAAFDKGHTSATATIDGGTIELDATSLPRLSGKHYEVWLTNDQRTRMQPVGWIGNDGRANLTVPPEMTTRYGDLEVSVQSANASDYTYSGTSVLRGSL